MTKTQIMLLLGMLVYDLSVYSIGRVLSKESVHYNFTTGLDEAIPFLPWMITIYLGCYLFWTANYIIIVKISRESALRLFIAHFSGLTVCFFLFLILPTTMVRQEIMGNSFWEMLVKTTYGIDAADNLLPSIHCFVSWLCYIGLKRSEIIPKWYKIFSLVFAIAVCISTLTVKQHVIVDAVAGILLAELSYAAGCALTERRLGGNR